MPGLPIGEDREDGGREGGEKTLRIRMHACETLSDISACSPGEGSCKVEQHGDQYLLREGSRSTYRARSLALSLAGRGPMIIGRRRRFLENNLAGNFHLPAVPASTKSISAGCGGSPRKGYIGVRDCGLARFKSTGDLILLVLLILNDSPDLLLKGRWP